jgi:hypothetical protein
MPPAANIRPDERILILGAPAAEEAAALARSVPQGLIVVLADDDAVRAARKSLVSFLNVMCVPGSPLEIPWRDGFFSRVIDVVGRWDNPERVASECLRVTAESGR